MIIFGLSPLFPGKVSHVLACAISTVVIYLSVSPTASASIYKMYTCNVPGVMMPAGGAEPWSWILDGLHTQPFDSCVGGGGFGISFPPEQQLMSPGTSAALHLRRPDSGPRAAIGIVGYRTWLVANLAGSGAPAFVSDGGAFAPPGGANTDGEPWVSPRLALTNPAIFVQLYCSTGDAAGCAFASSRPLTARGITVDLYENISPSGSIDGGTLLGNETHSGKETVNYTAIDHESGIERVDVLLGNTIVGSQDFAARTDICPHRNFNACAATQAGGITVDTSLVADGPSFLTLRLTDAAANQATIRRPVAVDVSNAGAERGAPIRADTTHDVTLTAQFPTGGRRYTSTYGHAVMIRGRLTDRSGMPISSARIKVRERQSLPDARSVERASIKTDAAGRYRYRLARSATSRSIQFRYQSSGDSPSYAMETVVLRVRSVARLRVLLSGVIVRYDGVVVAKPIPAGGKRLLVQGRAKGSAWRTFAVRRTDALGRFSGRYQLRVRRPGVQLQFRVVIPSQSRYPYTSGMSTVVIRKVR
jgi:hypothetical protein